MKNVFSFKEQLVPILTLENLKRCKYIKFTVIPNADIVGNLGELFDKKLTCKQHIMSCCNKALKLVGCVRRNTKNFSDIQCIQTLYVSLVRSNLECRTVDLSTFQSI